MAWDLAFNIQWTQRIEKEERAFVEASGEKAATTPDTRRHRRRGTGGSRGSRGSSTLSAAGGSVARTPSSPSLRGGESDAGRSLMRSSGSRASTGRMRQPSDEVYVPDHLRAVSRFPVADKDLMTARVEPTNDGKVGRVKFRPEEVKAMWWPGRGSYTKFHPEFSFEDPPAWTPEDILRHGSSRGGSSRRSRSSA